MQTVPGGVTNFEPVVRFHTSDEWAIRFTTSLRARYEAERIEIPVPLVRNLNEPLLDDELESLQEDARRR
jgi:hypothetical protein